jgi:hypothetical protein
MFGHHKYTTGLSFALERIGPLAAIIITVSYLLVHYLFALPNTPENPFASIYSESLIKTTSQHLLLLVGFDTLIYRKYYDTPLYLWVITSAATDCTLDDCLPLHGAEGRCKTARRPQAKRDPARRLAADGKISPSAFSLFTMKGVYIYLDLFQVIRRYFFSGR